MPRGGCFPGGAAGCLCLLQPQPGGQPGHRRPLGPRWVTVLSCAPCVFHAFFRHSGQSSTPGCGAQDSSNGSFLGTQSRKGVFSSKQSGQLCRHVLQREEVASPRTAEPWPSVLLQGQPAMVAV